MKASLITISIVALALGSNAQIDLPRLWQIGGSTDYITQIALSPDKRYLASCDHSGFVRLWRLDDLQLLWARHIGGSVNAIQISPDGRWIVCTTTSRTPPLAGASGLLLRIADGEVIRNLLGGFRFAFSPDGQLLAYSDRNQLRVLRLTDEAVLFQTPHPFGFEQGDVLFVPNTELVCLHGWSDSERATLLKVWNWRTGALVHEARFPNASPGRLAVPADGRYLAAGLVYYSNDCYIALEVVILQPHAQWRVATRLTHDRTGGQMYMRCSISLSEYLALDFSPDGRMLAVGGAYISLWDTRTWTNLRALGIPGAVGTPGTFATALRFRDSQTLVAGYSDGRLLQWRIERDPVRLLRKRLGSLVFSAAISADGQIGAFGDSNRAIEVWNLAQGRRLWLRTVPPDRGSSVALTRQGDRVACSGAEGIEVRDALTGALIEVIPLQGAPLTFDPEGNRLVVAQNEGVDSLLLVWDLVNRR
ncbi:MAG: WD40 repeat domain-containing protein, partial [Fimbriimonadales bacterium]|nr:WD40 repeat domain-containing protein [Fimbriimonadales bacterium]